MEKISTWDQFFTTISDTLYFTNLKTFWEKSYAKVVYPPSNLVLNAFTLTPLSTIKVVIIGQDPYHNEGQAMGLAFSVPRGRIIPPSLRNIFKEMEDDVGVKPSSGDLTYLAKQGVFLLNTILTVEENKPLSHDISEYKALIIDVIKVLNSQPQPIVFLLWGNHAKAYKKYLNGSLKLVIEGNHPSPLSANRGGFFKGKYFSKTNDFLYKNGVNTINWSDKA